MPNTDRYKKAGYETREDYLNDLAVRYCVNPIIVSGLAGILGDEEDFDGLVSAIEDMRDMIPADRTRTSTEKQEDRSEAGLRHFITINN